MFQNLTLFQAIIKGGPVFFILIIASVISIAVIVERFIKLNSIKKHSKKFMDQILSRVKARKIEEAIQLCRENDNIISTILLSILERKNKSKEVIEEAIQREGAKFTLYLEKRLYILATAGSSTPFIGLFGTVLGIINAFKSITLSENFSAALVSNGIAEALINTAAGLFVAIPAVIAYNYFATKIQAIIKEVEIYCSMITEILTDK